MEATAISKQKTIEFAIWLVGVIGIMVVIVYQRNLIDKGYNTKGYFSYILFASIILLVTSLVLKIKREQKMRRFSILNHTREIIRTLAALGFAIYALMQN
jgi:CDP-diglyceride synthetase